jgi:periplasmic protein TonB
MRTLVVYIDVFEQSILIDHGVSKPWNFLASLSAELLAVSVVLIIPLAYSDHLPEFHWKSVTMGPAPKPIVPKPLPPSPTHGTTHSPFPHRYMPSYRPPGANESPVTEFRPEAPPSITTTSGGSDTGLFERLLVITPPTAPTKPPAAHVEPSTEPMRVSGGVQMAKLIRKVMPVYPPLAKSARISGVVHLVGIIAKDGTIRDLQLVSGHPLLARAALEAVGQWIYKPTTLNGEPVEVIAPIDVSFTLSQ